MQINSRVCNLYQLILCRFVITIRTSWFVDSKIETNFIEAVYIFVLLMQMIEIWWTTFTYKKIEILRQNMLKEL